MSCVIVIVLNLVCSFRRFITWFFYYDNTFDLMYKMFCKNLDKIAQFTGDNSNCLVKLTEADALKTVRSFVVN